MSRQKQNVKVNIEDEIENHLDILNKPMPSSDEAEDGLLSCILQAPSDYIPLVQQANTKDLIYHSERVKILDHILKLYEETTEVDPVTLSHSLRESNVLDKVGGPAAISELYAFVPIPSHFPYYLAILKDKRTLRELIRKSALTIFCAQNHINSEKPVNKLVSEAEDLILSIQANSSNDFTHAKNSAMEAIEDIQYAIENPGSVKGLCTGFKKLDYLTTGLKGGEMFVIAARPSVGKSSLMMNIVEHVAILEEKNVAVFSLEVQTVMMVKALICRMGGLSLHDVSNGLISRNQQQLLAIALRKIQMSNIFIDDTSSIDIKIIRSKARRLHKQLQNNPDPKKRGLHLIAIDYIQLVTDESESYREQEISKISSGIKALAKELNIPIIVLAQLNRKVEERKEKRPMLSDLRESGSIEQDADLVGLLTRSAYFGNKQPTNDDEIIDEREAKLILAKNRNGPTDDVDLLFEKEITRFKERE